MPRSPLTLRYLHDLAQRSSFVAKVPVGARRATVGVGVTPSVANAELLVELLQLPGSGFRVAHRHNIVLVARASEREALALVFSCIGEP